MILIGSCEKRTLCEVHVFPLVFQSEERPCCFGKADMADWSLCFMVPEASKESLNLTLSSDD